MFRTHAEVVAWMAKTQTRTGLTVTVELLDAHYETGRNVDPAFKQHMPIVFDEHLPKWNYRAIPNA